MKKICIVSSSHGRNDTRMYQKQTVTLANSGFKVIYVVVDGEADEEVGNYVVTSLGIKGKGKIDRLLFLSSKLFKPVLEVNADVYQICEPELFPLGLKLKKHGKTVIFDSVEDYEGYYLGMYSGLKGKLMSRITAFIQKRYLKSFDLTLVMSPNIQSRLDKYAPGKVKMVCNYPIVTEMKKNSEFSKVDYINNGNTFIYAGSVYDFSEQESVLDSLSKLNYPNSKYVIVGVTPDYRKDSLENANGADKLELISWIERSKLEKLYQSSCCGIVIFHYTPVCCYKEGQMGSNKIFEYMLEGLPVICTDFDLWKKLIIEKYHCGICVCPEDKTEIYNAVKYIMDHKDEAYEMGQRGREAVLKEFNWGTQSQVYIELLQDLIKKDEASKNN